MSIIICIFYCNYFHVKTSVDGKITVSEAEIVPEISDNGEVLTCRVETPGIREITEDEWVLPVNCRFYKLIYTINDTLYLI